ncbi:MAG: UvrD-helicase domain-containing protein [Thermoanaerobaculum sp.]
MERGWDFLRGQDRQTRALAVGEFARPLLVEAGAGTGKTALLVARILAWSLGPGWTKAELDAKTPREVAGRVAAGVAAITFTEKAAAEMGMRLAESLASLLSGRIPPGLELATLPAREVLAERAGALLGVLDHFTLCTIHAYCLRLLSRYPLEAGLVPGFQVDAEGLGLGEAAEEALTEFLAAPDEALLPAFRALAAAGVGPEALREALVALAEAGVGPEDLASYPLDSQVAELAAQLRRYLRRLAQLVSPLVSEKRLKKAQEIWNVAAALVEAPLKDHLFLEKITEELRAQKLLPKLKDWSSGRFAASEEAVLANRLTAVQLTASKLVALMASASRCRPSFWRAFFAFGQPLLTRVVARLREHGLVTYQDLLTQAVRLLQENPSVARRERQRLTQLLVDEFQDTDRFQAELVELLALSGEGERPGLLLVGDPKQSIYGWRSADLAVYDAFKDKVKAAGGEILPLVVNFRSVPAILGEVQRVVAPVMLEEPGVQPAYQELVPFRAGPADMGFEAGPHRAVEYWVCWRFDGDRALAATRLADSRALEAEALASHLRELHDAHRVPYSEMAILLRAFSDADTYLEALRRYGVPYATTHDRTYFQRREVLDLACLLHAVVDPEDQLSLTGFLRSPWAGIPDAAWLELKKRGFFDMAARLCGRDGETLQALRALLQEVAAGLPEELPGRDRIQGWERSALWALSVLGLLRKSFAEDPVDVFLANLRSWLLLEATEAARFPGKVRLANVDRFFRLFVEGVQALGREPGEVVQVLRRAVEETREEAGSHPPEAEDAVLVTTIHQAKGLDFDHVFVADVARATADRRAPEAGAWWFGPGVSREVALRVGQFVTPNVFRLEEWEEKVASAESVRLLYVALTRAKERLVISGHWPEKPKEGSLVGLLAGRHGDASLEELAAACGEEDRIVKDGVVWVFPGKATRGEPPTRGQKALGVSVATVREQAHELVVARTWAVRRQNLPFAAPVSAESHQLLREAWAVAAEVRHGDGENAATVAGTVIHRVFESWNFEIPDGRRELAAQLQRLFRYVLPGTPEEVAKAGLRRAERILERFSASGLAEAFHRLGPRVLGREVPVLLAGDGERVAGFASGSVDLLYRGRDGPVVVDFKTDEVSPEDLGLRVEAYRPQLSLYARAVAEALALERLPRCELWFVAAGVVAQLDPEGGSFTLVEAGALADP